MSGKVIWKATGAYFGNKHILLFTHPTTSLVRIVFVNAVFPEPFLRRFGLITSHYANYREAVCLFVGQALERSYLPCLALVGDV